MAAYDLTTVANVKSLLRISGSGDDALLAILVSAYSTAIAHYAQREFKSRLATPDNQTRAFRYAGGTVLSLAPYELRAVDSVTLYSDYPVASQTVLAAGTPPDYVAMPAGGTPESGTYLWLRLPRVDVSGIELGSIEVEVTGDWGAGTVPADVELACMIAVAEAFRNPEQFAARELGELSFAIEQDSAVAPDSLPPASRRLLYPYRRMVVG